MLSGAAAKEKAASSLYRSSDPLSPVPHPRSLNPLSKKQTVVFSTSRTAKTVDKTAMLNARKGKFAMDKPFPGVPPLKPPGGLKVRLRPVAGKHF